LIAVFTIRFRIDGLEFDIRIFAGTVGPRGISGEIVADVYDSPVETEAM